MYNRSKFIKKKLSETPSFGMFVGLLLYDLDFSQKSTEDRLRDSDTSIPFMTIQKVSRIHLICNDPCINNS